ncbi:MAG: hypothetical protein WCL02_02375 [bacterium]
MYTPIIASIIFADEINVGFQLDVNSLNDLVKNNIISVNRSLIHFARSKNKEKDGKTIALKMSKDKLTSEIGVSMEILENAVFLSIQVDKIKFDDKTKQDIKKLFIKVDKLIHKLGENNSDFEMRLSTQRARPSEEAMDFIKKKW